MKIQALVDRFGSNRLNAAEPGKLLRGCSCIAVPVAVEPRRVGVDAVLRDGDSYTHNG